tara:strand:- start:208 stop:540 length:333 start_codon:yes stop_codon:yes gene_type:complete
MLEEGSDYKQATLPFYRRRAAILLQRAFRKKRLMNSDDINTFFTDKSGDVNKQRLTNYANALKPISERCEPTHPDMGFLKNLKQSVNNGQLHEINDEQHDFVRNYLWHCD